MILTIIFSIKSQIFSLVLLMSQTIGKNTFWSRLVRAYQIDPHKYQKKGFGLYVGYFLLVSYFTLLPAFFQWILPYLHQYVPQKLITAFGIFVINLTVILSYNLVMMKIYQIKHPFFQSFRVNHNPWPWQENQQKWRKILKKSIKFFTINNILIGVPMAIFDAYRSNYRTSVEQAPQTITILCQFVVFLLFQDFLFYVFHALFHHPKIYWIHKHHHEYTNTIALAGQTAHPLQAVFGNAIPAFLGYKILSNLTSVHAITIWVFFTFRIIQGCDSHSGYEWSWAQAELLPFNAGSAYHNFHHSHNVGNYGSFFKFWDSLFETNIQYVKYRQKIEKQAPNQVQKTKQQ